MLPPVYIRAAAAISPQHTFGADAANFLNPAHSSANGKLFVQDANYSQYINPVAIRRMSRALKFAIAAGMQCLADAGIATPDAIITGTGNGSVGDMQTFLLDMIRLEEGTLNPTAFIQSTYNAPNGWLALQSKCTGYNQTYVHRGSSLELALQDAQLLIAAGDAQTVLTGCFDELTDNYFTVKEKAGYYQNPPPADSLQLLTNAARPGTVGGEGSAFFLLQRGADGAGCMLRGAQVSEHADSRTIAQEVSSFLASHHLSATDIDLVLSGFDGNSRYEDFYRTAALSFPDATIAGYKHLCGAYDTASGFGLWLCMRVLATQQVPGISVLKAGTNAGIRQVLMINHSVLGAATMMLVAVAE